MLLLEQILVAGARVDHRRHVDVVEGGQQRGGVLRFLEAGGDGLAQPRHLDALFLRCSPAQAGVQEPRSASLAARRCGFRLRRLGPGLRRGTGLRPLFCASAAATHIVLGQPAVLAGALDLRRVDMMLEHRAAHRRRQGRDMVVGRRSVRARPRARACGSGACSLAAQPRVLAGAWRDWSWRRRPPSRAPRRRPLPSRLRRSARSPPRPRPCRLP